MFGVGEALEEAVGGAQLRKSHFGPVDERGEAFAMAFAGFTEEDSFDAAAGAKGFFDEADSFDAYGAGFGGQAAAESHAKLFEVAIVAARQDSGRGRRRAGGVAGGFAWGSHQGERNKFPTVRGNPGVKGRLTASLSQIAAYRSLGRRST
jgi:hypothetical protein